MKNAMPLLRSRALLKDKAQAHLVYAQTLIAMDDDESTCPVSDGYGDSAPPQSRKKEALYNLEAATTWFTKLEHVEGIQSCLYIRILIHESMGQKQERNSLCKVLRELYHTIPFESSNWNSFVLK